MQNLEASISFVDPLNPGVGYQIRITRAAPPGAPVEVLFTSRNPATDHDLLTYEQCLDVLTTYSSAPREIGTFIQNVMQYVEDRDYAWFTMDRDAANAMVLDLALRAGENFEIIPHVTWSAGPRHRSGTP
jgi:hypothetical protein